MLKRQNLSVTQVRSKRVSFSDQVTVWTLLDDPIQLFACPVRTQRQPTSALETKPKPTRVILPKEIKELVDKNYLEDETL